MFPSVRFGTESNLNPRLDRISQEEARRLDPQYIRQARQNAAKAKQELGAPLPPLEERKLPKYFGGKVALTLGMLGTAIGTLLAGHHIQDARKNYPVAEQAWDQQVHDMEFREYPDADGHKKQLITIESEAADPAKLPKETATALRTLEELDKKRPAEPPDEALGLNAETLNTISLGGGMAFCYYIALLSIEIRRVTGAWKKSENVRRARLTNGVTIKPSSEPDAKAINAVLLKRIRSVSEQFAQDFRKAYQQDPVVRAALDEYFLDGQGDAESCLPDAPEIVDFMQYQALRYFRDQQSPSTDQIAVTHTDALKIMYAMLLIAQDRGRFFPFIKPDPGSPSKDAFDDRTRMAVFDAETQINEQIRNFREVVASERKAGELKTLAVRALADVKLDKSRDRNVEKDMLEEAIRTCDAVLEEVGAADQEKIFTDLKRLDDGGLDASSAGLRQLVLNIAALADLEAELEQERMLNQSN